MKRIQRAGKAVAAFLLLIFLSGSVASSGVGLRHDDVQTEKAASHNSGGEAGTKAPAVLSLQDSILPGSAQFHIQHELSFVFTIFPGYAFAPASQVFHSEDIPLRLFTVMLRVIVSPNAP